MSQRSEHLTMYGLVGVAMHAVVGILVVASFGVVDSVGAVVLSGLWLLGAGLGAATWKRTVWVPLLASIVVAAVWMAIVLTSR